jgi:hypothetical protein
MVVQVFYCAFKDKNICAIREVEHVERYGRRNVGDAGGVLPGVAVVVAATG